MPAGHCRLRGTADHSGGHIAGAGNQLDQEWRAQEPQDLFRLAAERPRFVSRQFVGQCFLPRMLRFAVAERGVDDIGWTDVAMRGIEMQAGEHNDLIGFDGGAVEVNAAASFGRCQVGVPATIARRVHFQANVLIGIWQRIDPLLLIRRRRADQRDRARRHAGTGDVIENRGDQVGDSRQMFIDDDRHMIVGRQSSTKRGILVRSVQSGAHGCDGIGFHHDARRGQLLLLLEVLDRRLGRVAEVAVDLDGEAVQRQPLLHALCLDTEGSVLDDAPELGTESSW